MDLEKDHTQLLAELDILRQQVIHMRHIEHSLRESEEWFRLLYMQAPVPYQSLDFDGHLLEVNSSWLAELGYERDEVIGQWFGDFLTSDSAERFRERFPLFKEHGETHNTIFEMRHKNGTTLTVAFEGRIGHDERGHFLQTHCVFNNITERAKTEKALHESERQFRDILENVRLVAVRLNLQGEIMFCNQFLLDLTGWQIDEVLGKNWFELFVPPVVRNEIRRTLLSSISEVNFPRHHENEILTRAGQRRSILWNNILLHDPEGDIVGIASLGEDITERKLAVSGLRASETKFRAIFENSVDAIGVSVQGIYVDGNPAYIRMFGYNSVEDLLDHPLVNDIAPGDRERVADYIQRRARGEPMPTEYQVRGVRQDGTEFEMDVHVSQYELDGKLYTVGMLRDVTERNRTERAEREQRAFADALVKTVEAINGTLDFDEVLTRILNVIGEVIPHDGANIMLLDDGRLNVVEFCECYQRHGLTPPNMDLPWRLEDLPHLQQMINSLQPLAIPDTVLCPTWLPIKGRESIRSYVAAPIWDGGQVVGILNLDSMTPNFFSDWHAERLKAFANQAAIAIKNARMFQKLSTYSQDLEQAVQERTAQLTTAYSELEVLSRVKDEFVSNVSHELRSPLTSLMLRETLLARHPDNLDEHLPVIERETKRLQHTIDDLLRLSRLDQGRLEAVLRPLDLNELVQQLVEDRELTAQEAGLQLLFEACPDVPPVEADYGLLGQVLGILVTNAINYTPAGGRVIARVQVRSDGWAGFSIEDTGPGISSDDQARLFERFFRGNVGRQSKAHGTGLGLAIAKAIVEQHQGQIDVKSEPGQGAAFAVWLPARSSR